jgi:hypothetical protein
MWSWIIGFIVIVGIIVFVMNRRGSTGASRADDLPSTGRADNSGGGFIPPGSAGDGGAGGM